MNRHARPTPPPSRFMADAMLGRLARWLRMLGYDTAYEKLIADDRIIDRTLREARWLLTRDRYLAQRKVLRGRHTLLASDNLDHQLMQLHDELSLQLNLDTSRPFRCVECNVVLQPLSCEAAAAIVLPFVAQHYREFRQCKHCSHVYWPGTHWEAVTTRLALLRSGEASADR